MFSFFRKRPFASGVAAALVLVLFGMAAAMTVTQFPYGISTNQVYTWSTSNAWVGSYYMQLPTLTGNDTFAGIGTAQTFTNKTLTTPVIASLYQDAGKTKLVTFPAQSITVPGTVINNCATTSTCSATNISSTSKVVMGSVALLSASPSAVTVTGMPAFTSSSSFVCTATDATAALAVKVVNATSASITLTSSGNSNTDTVNYICVGN
jgi:hypothetical protein